MRLHGTAIGMMMVLGMVLFGANEAKAQGFVFGGPMVLDYEPYLNAGISGEKRVYKGLGLVVGLSILGRQETGFVEGIGGALFSLNGSYNFRLNHEKLEPFVTAGASGVSVGYGGTGGPNFGGGVTYWFKERRGIRAEYRVHAWEYAPSHEVRFGFVWGRR